MYKATVAPQVRVIVFKHEGRATSVHLSKHEVGQNKHKVGNSRTICHIVVRLVCSAWHREVEILCHPLSLVVTGSEVSGDPP